MCGNAVIAAVIIVACAPIGVIFRHVIECAADDQSVAEHIQRRKAVALVLVFGFRFALIDELHGLGVDDGKLAGRSGVKIAPVVFDDVALVHIFGAGVGLAVVSGAGGLSGRFGCAVDLCGHVRGSVFHHGVVLCSAVADRAEHAVQPVVGCAFGGNVFEIGLQVGLGVKLRERSGLARDGQRRIADGFGRAGLRFGRRGVHGFLPRDHPYGSCHDRHGRSCGDNTRKDFDFFLILFRLRVFQFLHDRFFKKAFRQRRRFLFKQFFIFVERRFFFH